MKTSDIYQEYTYTLRELDALYAQYRNLSPEATDAERVDIRKRVERYRKKLAAITEQLISSNPFMKGGQRSFNEELL